MPVTEASAGVTEMSGSFFGSERWLLHPKEICELKNSPHHVPTLTCSNISSPQLINGLDSKLISRILMDFPLKIIISVCLLLIKAHRLDLKSAITKNIQFVFIIEVIQHLNQDSKPHLRPTATALAERAAL